MNSLNSKLDHLKESNGYLEALKLSCLRNIELANQELEAQKYSAQVNRKKSWFSIISPKKIKAEPKNLAAYKSNLCRQMLLSKKINELNSKTA